MLNIVIPMAGAGSRFANAGYKDPKPLIPVHNLPMIRLVIENLKPNCDHRFIFITQQSYAQNYNLRDKLTIWAPGCEVLELDGITEGAACTVITAKHLINNDDNLMIANSDQFVDVDINDYLNYEKENELNGLIMTMKANDPKWSFVGLNSLNLVASVVEKQVISDEATVGIYNFSKGADFISGAESMIKNNERVNGEFYVAPVYNSLIEKGQKIGIYNIGSEGNGMYGLGIPSDLKLFVNNPISLAATSSLL